MNGVPHRSGRNLHRDLMWTDKHGSQRVLASGGARRVIKTHESIRRAARALGVAKSTLHDLATDTNKIGASRPTRKRS